MVKKFVLFIHGPVVIAFFNLLIAFVTMRMLVELYPLITDANKYIEQVSELTEGILVIYICYGVALESREHLLNIYKIYPKMKNEFQETVDKICEDYGILYLVIALMAEIIIQTLIIPDEVINTQGLEIEIMSLFFITQIVLILLSLRHAYMLLKLTFFTPHKEV